MTNLEKVNGGLANSSQTTFVVTNYGAEISAKLDRIIELLERMVQPEDQSSDDEPACPECGSDELERYATAEDGADKAICTTCNHRFVLGTLSG